MKKHLFYFITISLLSTTLPTLSAERDYSPLEKQVAQSLEKIFQNLEQQVKEEVEKSKTPGLVRGLGTEPSARAFLLALTQTELFYVLQDEAPHTLLVPTNEAFLALPADVRNRLINDPAFAKKVVANHIFGGNLNGKGLWRARYITSAAGEKVRISYWKKHLYANKVKISKPNQMTRNGTFHLIDQVLLPAS